MNNNQNPDSESIIMPPLDQVGLISNRSELSDEVNEEDDHVSDITLLTQCTNSASVQSALLREDEVTMNEEQKRDLLIRSYAILTPKSFNAESLNTIRLIVNRDIVSSVKFVRNEHVDGRSKQLRDKTKQFPSFWQPDLRKDNTMYTDILKQVGNLNNEKLQTKVMYWLGIREKVLETIRSYRSNTLTKLKKDIVEGKFLLLLITLFQYNLKKTHDTLLFC